MTTNIDKKQLKAVIFDLDGTLLNTIDTIYYYLNLSLGRHGLPTVSEGETMSFVGDGAVKLIERAMDRVGADRSLFDSIYRFYNEAYNSDPYHLTMVYDGIAELICRLRESDISLAVLSNKPDFAVKAAVDHFFPDSFDVVLGGRESVCLKPAPDAIYEIAQKLGISIDEIAYVGDSEVDVLTADNAGIHNAYFVSWGFRTAEQLAAAGAKRILNSASDLLNILKTDVI